MAQYALPVSDDLTTNWSEGAGDGDGDAFDELDEGFGAGRGSGSGPDDATTYWETGTAAAEIRMRPNAVTDPATGVGHVYRTRNRKHASGGQQIDITSKFSATGLGTITQLSVNVDNVWTTRGRALTEVEADSISNYGLVNKQVATLHTEVGGGSPRSTQESAHEFECPDVAGVSLPVFQRPLRVFHGRF